MIVMVTPMWLVIFNLFDITVILLTAVLGIFISHLMRGVIKKMNILNKSIKKQIIYFLLITFSFTILFIALFNFIILALQIINPEGGIVLLIILLNSVICGLSILIWNLVYFIYHYVVKVRKEEQQKAALQIQMMESESKALRAQMNPHFIFNSLNSIKLLIQKNNTDDAAEYLITFSKLIRTLFQNTDKREISLYEEVETCRLYSQIEAMRLNYKVEFSYRINPGLDLKDIKVPALILQPFIENAIWHGLVPKNDGSGSINIIIDKTESGIECVIDDDGIGRELSQQYKTQYNATHKSRGMGLTESRLDLDKLLSRRDNTIEIIDKKDEQGKPLGTKVVITFKDIKE